MPQKKTAPTPPKRTPPGRGLRVKIKGDWRTALGAALKKGPPPKGWTPPPANSEEE